MFSPNALAALLGFPHTAWAGMDITFRFQFEQKRDYILKNSLLVLAWLLTGFAARAQSGPDTLFMQRYYNQLVLLHTIQPEDSLEAIAHRYGVDPQTLASINGIAFPAALEAGKALRVPLNGGLLSDSVVAAARPVYFRCDGRENLVVLAGSLGKTFRALQNNNPGLKQYCTGGAQVLLGYLLPLEKRPEEVIPEKDALPPLRPDRPEADWLDIRPEEPMPALVPEAEATFKSLTDAGVPLNEQTGPVVFFPGGSGETYYAFHSGAPHGTILRLRNPANGREVYAKVIGKLPGSKNFYRALAGVSDNARRALGSLGDARLWCEVAYAGY